MVCKKCGAESAGSVQFCTNCGGRLVPETFQNANGAVQPGQNSTINPTPISNNQNAENTDTKKSNVSEDHSFIKLVLFFIFLYFIYQLFTVFSTISENAEITEIIFVIAYELVPKLMRILMAYSFLSIIYYRKKVNIISGFLRFIAAIFVFAFVILGEDKLIEYIKEPGKLMDSLNQLINSISQLVSS